MRSLKVLMMPDYRADNPYQQLLADALAAVDVDVGFPQGYRRVFPVYRAWQDAGKPRVFHLHWPDPYLRQKQVALRWLYARKLLLELSLLRLAGGRLVWTLHNLAGHDTRHAALERMLYRGIAAVAGRIIVHSRAALLEALPYLGQPESKYAIIPHGHYRSVYRAAIDRLEARRVLRLPEMGKVFLNLGMMRPYKGVPDLLAAWPEYHRRNQADTLLLAGAASDKAFAEVLRATARGLQGIVWHDAFIDDTQMHLYFSAADIAVLPFRAIFTSGSLVLAMSYGKPVIAPRLGNIPESLADGADALLYDPSSTDGLLRAMLSGSDANLQTLAERTTAACDKLAWSFIANDTKSCYEAA